jgi:sulfide:quinone oxidoreductase
LGAGTGGTVMLNKLNGVLDKNEWQITIVDQNENHYYQPGFLFIPFEIYSKKDVIKPKRDFYACKASVDMFHLKKEDFCKQVEDIISVGQFYEKSAGAQIIFT